MKIAIIGGTGRLGLGLAKHLSRRNEVIIGSRDPGRAIEAARKVAGASGSDYGAACRDAETVVFAVPYSGLAVAQGLVSSVEGKLVLSAVNPLKSDAGVFRSSAPGGSAAEELARLFPRSRVATAFNNVPAPLLKRDDLPHLDILIAADAKETFKEAAAVVSSVKNMRPLYAGPLSQAAIVEGLTALILNLGKLNGATNVAALFEANGDPL